jgi:hypothetical protein
VGVQKMVRSDRAGTGVLFTLNMDSGFPDVVVINTAWGLGETVVQGSVSPDEYKGSICFLALYESGLFYMKSISRGIITREARNQSMVRPLDLM